MLNSVAGKSQTNAAVLQLDPCRASFRGGWGAGGGGGG